jgi:hypothetical protein
MNNLPVGVLPEPKMAFTQSSGEAREATYDPEGERLSLGTMDSRGGQNSVLK